MELSVWPIHTSAITYPLLKSRLTFLILPFRLKPSNHLQISRGSFDLGSLSPKYYEYILADSRFQVHLPVYDRLPDFWALLQTMIFLFECFSWVWVEAFVFSLLISVELILKCLQAEPHNWRTDFISNNFLIKIMF